MIHPPGSDVEHFDAWSRRYERSPLQRLFFDRVHGAVLAAAGAFPPPASALDVGCGTGRLLRAMRARWPRARLVGVDASPGMIEIARRLTPDAELHVATAERLPLADASIDLACSTVSFHHWSDHERALREVARVLAPGGRFLLADLALPRWIGIALGDRPYLGAARRAAVFTRAGLAVVEQRWLVFPAVLLTVGRRA